LGQLVREGISGRDAAVCIFTDCKSIVEALNSRKGSTKRELQLLSIINEIAGRVPVKVLHVKAHCGIIENERVDAAANKAAGRVVRQGGSGGNSEGGARELPHGAVKSMLKDWVKAARRDEILSRSARSKNVSFYVRSTNNLKNRILLNSKLPRAISTALNQMQCNKSARVTGRHWITGVVEQCEHCSKVGAVLENTIEHFLVECPKYAKQRAVMRRVQREERTAGAGKTRRGKTRRINDVLARTFNCERGIVGYLANTILGCGVDQAGSGGGNDAQADPGKLTDGESAKDFRLNGNCSEYSRESSAGGDSQEVFEDSD